MARSHLPDRRSAIAGVTDSGHLNPRELHREENGTKHASCISARKPQSSCAPCLHPAPDMAKFCLGSRLPPSAVPIFVASIMNIWEKVRRAIKESLSATNPAAKS